jgi:hypothetical protein
MFAFDSIAARARRYAHQKHYAFGMLRDFHIAIRGRSRVIQLTFYHAKVLASSRKALRLDFSAPRSAFLYARRPRGCIKDVLQEIDI